jgi:hypothetical protein
MQPSINITSSTSLWADIDLLHAMKKSNVSSLHIVLIIIAVGLFITLLLVIANFVYKCSETNNVAKRDSYRPVSLMETDDSILPPSHTGNDLIDNNDGLDSSFRQSNKAMKPLADDMSTNNSISSRNSVSSSSTKKDALLDTFMMIMSQGILVKLHTIGGPKDVRISIKKNSTELQWEQAQSSNQNFITGKKYKLDLVEVRSVIIGKKTSNFLRATSAKAHEDLCFSLVCDSLSMDIELNRKIERDSVSHGFALFIEKLTNGIGVLQDEKKTIINSSSSRSTRSTSSYANDNNSGIRHKNYARSSAGRTYLSDLTWES